MSTLFDEHFAFVRDRLIAAGKAAQSFHHSTNRGNIRETFARELFDNSTSAHCSVGTGEIIHRSMKHTDERNQIDVILYNNRFPKISVSSGTELFFVDTVSSFIEVKSKVTKADIRQAAEASKKIKNYPYCGPQRFNPGGMVKNPRPYSFLFAYDSSVNKIETVLKWMKEVSAEEDYNLDTLRSTAPDKRPFFQNLFLDGVFVLNQGFVALDAMPSQSIIKDVPNIDPSNIWIYDNKDELQHLWAWVNLASEMLYWNDPDLLSYLPTKTRMVTD